MTHYDEPSMPENMEIILKTRNITYKGKQNGIEATKKKRNDVGEERKETRKKIKAMKDEGVVELTA